MPKGRKQEWTRERVLHALADWAAANHGISPRSVTWDLARDHDRHPSCATIRAYCGSWNEAWRAVGCETRPRGWPGHLDEGARFHRLTEEATRC